VTGSSDAGGDLIVGEGQEAKSACSQTSHLWIAAGPKSPSPEIAAVLVLVCTDVDARTGFIAVRYSDTRADVETGPPPNGDRLQPAFGSGKHHYVITGTFNTCD
jgi:hypothetical protein